MAKAELSYFGFSSDSNRHSLLLRWPLDLTQTYYRESGQWSLPEKAEVPVLIYDRRIANLKKEIKELKEMLASFIQSNESEVPVIILRDIPVDQAKDEIARYFRENDGKDIDIDELIEGLAIDPHTVVRACNILEAEGKIG
jgi:hypothetical protein